MKNEKEKFANDIAGYRQPMVTSLGIIMGFLLNFLASWAISSEADGAEIIDQASDWLILLTLFASLIIMIFVLYRLLNNRADSPNNGLYYNWTFRLYITSLILCFAGLGFSFLL
jgi:Na+-driven multidrug efflux pump